MTIWILAVLLLASLAGLGYRQGVVRVSFSLVGILMGALLAVPLGHLVRPIFSAVGMKNPMLLWWVPTFVMFCVVLSGFKVAGHIAQRKVEVYHKYRAGELRYVLWERLSRRAGLCVGLLNGLAYLVLLSFVIHAVSYLTVQVTAAESESVVLRLVNSLGKDLESTGMNRVGHAVDRLPTAYYDAADVLGTLYHNQDSRVALRVSAYPAFLSLGQRQEFQQLGADADFKNLWANRASLMDVLKNPKVKAILQDPELLKTIWAAAKPNLQDFNAFLANGESATFSSERIVGRWAFDVNGAVSAERRLKPGMTAVKVAELRRYLEITFRSVRFVATPGQEVFLNNVPARTPGATPATVQGQWKSSGSKYEVSINQDGRNLQVPIELQGDLLAFTLDGRAYVFIREN